MKRAWQNDHDSCGKTTIQVPGGSYQRALGDGVRLSPPPERATVTREGQLRGEGYQSWATASMLRNRLSLSGWLSGAGDSPFLRLAESPADVDSAGPLLLVPAGLAAGGDPHGAESATSASQNSDLDAAELRVGAYRTATYEVSWCRDLERYSVPPCPPVGTGRTVEVRASAVPGSLTSSASGRRGSADMACGASPCAASC